MTYGYIRVSTEMQTVENQKLEISKYANRFELTIDEWVDETVSSRVSYTSRKLGELIDKLNPNDTLIVTEISRIGRDILEIAEIIKKLKDKGANCHAIKENYDLGDNIVSNCILFAFSLSAQIERDLISERTKMGLERARSQGKQIGRQKGQKPGHYKLDQYSVDIITWINEGWSIASIADWYGVKWETLRNWLIRNEVCTAEQLKDRKKGYYFQKGHEFKGNRFIDKDGNRLYPDD